MSNYLDKQINTLKIKNEINKKVLDNIQQYGSQLPSNTTNPSTSVNSSGDSNVSSGDEKEEKRQAEDAQKALANYIKSYEELRKSIIDIRRKFNQEDLTEEEKAIIGLNESYDKQLEIVEKFIAELEVKQKTKQGLNKEELDVLGKFHDQKKQLEENRESDLNQVLIDYQLKRQQTELAEKEKFEAEYKRLTQSQSTNEIEEVTARYQKLIAQAEKYGFSTVEIYRKMQEEIDGLTGNDINGDAGKSGKKIFGLTEEEWAKKFDDLGIKFEKFAKYAGAARSTLGAFFDFQNAKQSADLQQYEDTTEKKKQLLDDQLKKGVISQEKHDSQIATLDKKLENEKKRVAIEQAKRNKRLRMFDAVINTAGAVMNAMNTQPFFPLGLAMAVLAGIAGGLQIAAIAKEPLPKAAKGMRVNKPTTLLAGEAGREIILSNSIVDSPTLGPIADDLANIQEGKQPRFLGKPKTPNYRGMDTAIGRSPVQSVQNNTVNNINNVDNKSIDSMNDRIVSMSSDLKEFTKVVGNIKYLKAVMTYDDQQRFDKDEKFRKKYSGF